MKHLIPDKSVDEVINTYFNNKHSHNHSSGHETEIAAGDGFDGDSGADIGAGAGFGSTTGLHNYTYPNQPSNLNPNSHTNSPNNLRSASSKGFNTNLNIPNSLKSQPKLPEQYLTDNSDKSVFEWTEFDSPSDTDGERDTLSRNKFLIPTPISMSTAASNATSNSKTSPTLSPKSNFSKSNSVISMANLTTPSSSHTRLSNLPYISSFTSLDGMGANPASKSGFLGAGSSTTFLRIMKADEISTNEQGDANNFSFSNRKLTSPANKSLFNSIPDVMDSQHNTSSKYLDLSDQKIQYSFIESYFNSYHMSYPLLDKQHFINNIEQNLPKVNASWWCLYYTVTALGCWCMFGDSTNHDLYYYKLAKYHLSQVFESGNLDYVISLILLSNYAQKRNKPNTGWNYLGLAVSMAVSLGLYKEIELKDLNKKNVNEIKTFILDQESKRRIWWCLYMFDAGAAITFGRPSHIPTPDIMDIKLPSNLNDEKFDELLNDANFLSRFILSKNPTLPQLDYPTIYSAMIEQSKLSVLTDPFYTQIISKSRPSLADCHLMHSKLKEFSNNLPDYFRDDINLVVKKYFSNDFSKTPQWFLLSRSRLLWRIANLQILIFRPYIWQKIVLISTGRTSKSSTKEATLSEDSKNARRVCLNAASITIKNIIEYLSLPSVKLNALSSWYTTYFLFQAILIPLACQCSNPQSKHNHEWWADIIKGKRALAMLSTSNSTCIKLIHLIDGILKRHNAVLKLNNYEFNDLVNSANIDSQIDSLDANSSIGDKRSVNSAGSTNSIRKVSSEALIFDFGAAKRKHYSSLFPSRSTTNLDSNNLNKRAKAESKSPVLQSTSPVLCPTSGFIKESNKTNQNNNNMSNDNRLRVKLEDENMTGTFSRGFNSNNSLDTVMPSSLLVSNEEKKSSSVSNEKGSLGRESKSNSRVSLRSVDSASTAASDISISLSNEEKSIYPIKSESDGLSPDSYMYQGINIDNMPSLSTSQHTSEDNSISGIENMVNDFNDEMKFTKQLKANDLISKKDQESMVLTTDTQSASQPTTIPPQNLTIPPSSVVSTTENFIKFDSVMSESAIGDIDISDVNADLDMNVDMNVDVSPLSEITNNKEELLNDIYSLIFEEFPDPSFNYNFTATS